MRCLALALAALVAALLLPPGASATPDGFAQASSSPDPPARETPGPPADAAADAPEGAAAPAAPAVPADGTGGAGGAGGADGLDALGRTRLSPAHDAAAPQPVLPEAVAAGAAALLLLLALALPGVLLAARRHARPVEVVRAAPLRDDGRWRRDWVRAPPRGDR